MRTINLPGNACAALMMLFCIALVAASPAAAQKKGGTLRLYHNDNPPSTSLHEEATIASVTPFTAKDVQCTWRMLIGKTETQDFKRNPRKVWYTKLQDVSVNGDYEATFELNAPQPSLPVLLASAFSPVYPCHVSQQLMRTKPVGTGPFKLVEFNRGNSIRLVRNPDYWKKDRPY